MPLPGDPRPRRPRRIPRQPRPSLALEDRPLELDLRGFELVALGSMNIGISRDVERLAIQTTQRDAETRPGVASSASVGLSPKVGCSGQARRRPTSYRQACAKSILMSSENPIYLPFLLACDVEVHGYVLVFGLARFDRMEHQIIDANVGNCFDAVSNTPE